MYYSHTVLIMFVGVVALLSLVVHKVPQLPQAKSESFE